MKIPNTLNLFNKSSPIPFSLSLSLSLSLSVSPLISKYAESPHNWDEILKLGTSDEKKWWNKIFFSFFNFIIVWGKLDGFHSKFVFTLFFNIDNLSDSNFQFRALFIYH